MSPWTLTQSFLSGWTIGTSSKNMHPAEFLLLTGPYLRLYRLGYWISSHFWRWE